ncbi:MAG: spore maturation protein, partial [Chitinophagaceae bacterium]|nr:spore maturation protein [Chitinophagaceae bacterium]
MKRMYSTKLSRYAVIALAITAGTLLLQSCQKSFDKKLAADYYTGNGSTLQVFVGTVGASRNYVYVDGNPVNGSALSTGNLFPGTGFGFAVKSGLRTMMVRDTLSTTTQTALVFAQNFDNGNNYMVFTFDTITSPNYVIKLDAASSQLFSSKLSNGLILFIFVAIVVGGVYKKIDVFDAFVEGAKGGFETAIRIIPYIVGMLVAISLLRTSGSFDYLINGVKYLFAAMGTDTRFVDGLPTALIKPLSGSGARGMMLDTMKTYGPDSFAGRLSAVLQGSSDTTFYVVAVYFGSVGVRNTRYAIGSMLLADLVGVLTAIFLSYLFFA